MSLVALGRSVLPLDGAGVSIDDVGGKAAGLDHLASYGFPIPSSYVVTVGAYQRSVALAGLSPWLADLAMRPAPNPHDLRAEVDEIEDAFRAIALEADLRREIETAAAMLLARGRVAVRSSATAEDLGVASFAGQYRTFTRIDDIDGAIDAVKRCWASLWLPAAREYRLRHSVASSGLAMAVVLQSMVEADWSGVGFTIDPASDRRSMRVEMVPGLGEALVSGHVTPVDFSIRRDTLEITSSDPGTQPLRIIEDLARMMLQVETRFDEPQDIEWASVGSDLVLLQARPVTVVGPRSLFDDGFDEPVNSRDEFTPHGVVEMLPDTVSPLLWTINGPMIEHGYRSAVASLGGEPGSRQRPFVGRFRGRGALNLTLLQEIAESLPGGSASDVERQFLGTSVTDDDADRRSGRIRNAMRARRELRALNDEIDLVVTAADAIVDLDVDLASLPAWRLVGYRQTVRDLAWRIAAAEVSASSAASASYRALELVLARWLDEPLASTWAQRLTAGTLGRHGAGARLDRELRDAGDVASASDSTIAEPARTEPDPIARLLNDQEPAEAQLPPALARAARRAGSRAVYGGPTWEEAPQLVWQRLHMAARRKPQSAPDRAVALDELATLLRSRRSWKYIRVATGQIVDLRLRLIDHMSRTAAQALRMRERAKSALLTLGGEERRGIVEITARLIESHQMQSPEDVQLLADRELTGMLLGAPAPPRADLHWRRAVARRARQAPPLPDLFTGSPGVMPRAAVSDHVLVGWSASPGKAEAPARVVTDLADAARLRSGEILVAAATDPSWTSIIVNAAAVVLETGGPLSHAAIVAREFGIPAVLKVADATRLIEDGELIAVDGHLGSVLRIDVREGDA